MSHRKRCKPGELCLLYTWKRSGNEIGAFRECFQDDVQLGLATNPVKPGAVCRPQRTQADPASSIRACLCTTDLCNDVQGIYDDVRNVTAAASGDEEGKF